MVGRTTSACQAHSLSSACLCCTHILAVACSESICPYLQHECLTHSPVTQCCVAVGDIQTPSEKYNELDLLVRNRLWWRAFKAKGVAFAHSALAVRDTFIQTCLMARCTDCQAESSNVRQSAQVRSFCHTDAKQPACAGVDLRSSSAWMLSFCDCQQHKLCNSPVCCLAASHALDQYNCAFLPQSVPVCMWSQRENGVMTPAAVCLPAAKLGSS